MFAKKSRSATEAIAGVGGRASYRYIESEINDKSLPTKKPLRPKFNDKFPVYCSCILQFKKKNIYYFHFNETQC